MYELTTRARAARRRAPRLGRARERADRAPVTAAPRAPAVATISRASATRARAAGEAAVVAVARRDERRGRRRDRRRDRRRLDRARRLRPGLGGRGRRQRDHHLALHRLTRVSQTAEQRAQKLVAIQFFLLAPYVGVESVRALVGGEHPDVSVVGMALAVGSLVTMPLLGIAKQRIAEQIGSAATKGEGRQNMLCAYLAGALLSAWRATRRRRLVAGPGRRPADRRRRGQGGPGGLARRGLLRRLAARRRRLRDDACQDECCALPAR